MLKVYWNPVKQTYSLFDVYLFLVNSSKDFSVVCLKYVRDRAIYSSAITSVTKFLSFKSFYFTRNGITTSFDERCKFRDRFFTWEIIDFLKSHFIVSSRVIFPKVLAMDRTSLLTNAHSDTYSCDSVFPIIPSVLL